MTFDKIVGINESFPNKQYKLAIYELIDRYLIPRFIPSIKKNQAEFLAINKKQPGSKFNSGFDSFLNYTKKIKYN